MSKVRWGLGNPSEQSPTLDAVFSAVITEFQAFYNELSSSAKPWTYNTAQVTITNGVADYIVPAPPGKVMFVTGQPINNTLGAIALEFADLAEVSSDFYLFSPLNFGFSPDFNESVSFPLNLNVAFYRKNNSLWLRIAPYPTAFEYLTITYATGDWISGVSVNDEAVLSEHHHLPITRAQQNLLPMTTWTKDENANQLKRNNFERSFDRQIARYAEAFMYAKRNLTNDETNYRNRDDW